MFEVVMVFLDLCKPKESWLVDGSCDTLCVSASRTLFWLRIHTARCSRGEKIHSVFSFRLINLYYLNRRAMFLHDDVWKLEIM